MGQLARNSDPSTSHIAAAQTELFRASHEAKIFGALWAFPDGLTYRKIAMLAAMEPVAVARRLKAMERRGLICRVVTERGTYAISDGMCVWRKA